MNHKTNEPFWVKLLELYFKWLSWFFVTPALLTVAYMRGQGDMFSRGMIKIEDDGYMVGIYSPGFFYEVGAMFQVSWWILMIAALHAVFAYYVFFRQFKNTRTDDIYPDSQSLYVYFVILGGFWFGNWWGGQLRGY